MNRVKIKQLKNNKYSVANIVKIHQQSLRNNILANFGNEFLTRMYTGICNDKNNLLLVAVIKNRIVGYIVLNFLKEDFIKHIKFQDIIIFLKSLFSKPYLIFSLFCQLAHQENYPEQNSCEISHFAVLKSYRNKGIGNKLILKSINISKKKKRKFIKTKTNNYKLSNFYIKKYKAVLVKVFNVFNEKHFILKINTKNF